MSRVTRKFGRFLLAGAFVFSIFSCKDSQIDEFGISTKINSPLFELIWDSLMASNSPQLQKIAIEYESFKPSFLQELKENGVAEYRDGMSAPCGNSSGVGRWQVTEAGISVLYNLTASIEDRNKKTKEDVQCKDVKSTESHLFKNFRFEKNSQTRKNRLVWTHLINGKDIQDRDQKDSKPLSDVIIDESK